MGDSGLLISNNLKIFFSQMNAMHEKSGIFDDSEVMKILDGSRSGEPTECRARGKNGQSARSRLVPIVAPRPIPRYGFKREGPPFLQIDAPPKIKAH